MSADRAAVPLASIPWGDTASDSTKYALLEHQRTAKQCLTRGVELRLRHPRVQFSVELSP